MPVPLSVGGAGSRPGLFYLAAMLVLLVVVFLASSRILRGR
jgi:hypothetical protein